MARTAKPKLNDPRAWLDHVLTAAGVAHPQEPERDGVDPAEWVITRHGEPGGRFIEAVREPGTPRVALYAAKNATLALSIDATVTWSGALVRRQLHQMSQLKERLAPQRIIDVGCEQGLLTCFAAHLWPTAEVVGGDPGKQAIERARELAALLGIGNVRYVESPLQSLATNALEMDPFDLILTSRSILGEAIGTSAEEPGELLTGTSAADPDWASEASSAAANLQALARDGATLLSTERGSATGLMRWAGALASAGLYVDESRTSMIEVEESGLPDQTFMAIEATASTTGSPKAIDAQALLDVLSPPRAAGEGTREHGLCAEALARAAGICELVAVGQWRAAERPGEAEHIEAWLLGDGRLLEFRSSTLGQREAMIHPAHGQAAVAERLRAEIASHFNGPPQPAAPLLGPAAPRET